MYASLGELASTLILAVLQQLHNAALIGSESSDLTDEAADELGATIKTLLY